MGKLTKEQKNEICEKYLTGNYTCSALDREYSLDRTSISALLIRRKIKGIESHGMILMAKGKDGTLYNMEIDNAEVGAVI